MKTKSGFVGIFIIILVSVAALGGGMYSYYQTHLAVPGNEIQKSFETASSTDTNTVVTIGVTSKTKAPITAEVSVKTDTQGNKLPSIVVSKDVMNKAVVEKYGDNSAYINKNIKLIAITAFNSFVNEQAEIVRGREGTYGNVCKNANLFIETKIRKTISEDLEEGGLLTALKISLNSFRINEIVCKADNDRYIITMPVTLEDRTVAKLCSSSSGQSIGDANYETYTCINK